mgnify:CR=1 FL=1
MKCNVSRQCFHAVPRTCKHCSFVSFQESTGTTETIVYNVTISIHVSVSLSGFVLSNVFKVPLFPFLLDANLQPVLTF